MNSTTTTWKSILSTTKLHNQPWHQRNSFCSSYSKTTSNQQNHWLLDLWQRQTTTHQSSSTTTQNTTSSKRYSKSTYQQQPTWSGESYSYHLCRRFFYYYHWWLDYCWCYNSEQTVERQNYISHKTNYFSSCFHTFDYDDDYEGCGDGYGWYTTTQNYKEISINSNYISNNN